MSAIQSTVEIDMAWTEQTGMHAWRVRYPTSDGHIASISGFTNTSHPKSNNDSSTRCNSAG
jgi:hypothetical protein